MAMKVRVLKEKRIVETLNTRYVIHVSGYDTEGVVSLYEATFKRIGKNMNLHYHKNLTETFTILRGSFMFHIDGEDHNLGTADTVVVRPMQVHGFRALSPGSTMLITFSECRNRDDFFVELADRVNKGRQLDKAFYARFDQYYL